MGKVNHENLVELDLTEECLVKKLQKKNNADPAEVFYAQV